MWRFEDLLILLLISLPAFFFWRWLCSKFIKNSARRQLATWCSTLFITPFIYIGAIYLLLFWMCYYPKKDFDRKLWTAVPERRYEMTADIIQTKLLIGKTKNEIEQLLGKREFADSRDTWYYYVGILPGFSIDGDHLVVLFVNGKVTKVSGGRD